jgi:hypothetical protein
MYDLFATVQMPVYEKVICATTAIGIECFREAAAVFLPISAV